MPPDCLERVTISRPCDWVIVAVAENRSGYLNYSNLQLQQRNRCSNANQKPVYFVQLNLGDLAPWRRWRCAKFACSNRINKRASEAVLFDYPITWLVGTNGTPSPVQYAALTTEDSTDATPCRST